MTKVYISDTNIWIDIRNAGLLDEIFQLPITFCCTEFVLHELNDLPKDELVAQGLLIETLDDAAVSQLFTLKVQHGNSSLADVSCYFLAQQTGHPLLTGDGKLRKQASKDGIEIYGVLWLLDQLVALRLITSARAAEALETMIQHGARLPQADCHQRLQQWR
jgi:predicted nucleic acid-binding protein